MSLNWWFPNLASQLSYKEVHVCMCSWVHVCVCAGPRVWVHIHMYAEVRRQTWSICLTCFLLYFWDSHPSNGPVLLASKWRRGVCLHPPFAEITIIYPEITIIYPEITIIYRYIHVLFDRDSDAQTQVLMLAQKILDSLSNLSSPTREYSNTLPSGPPWT